jgi:hypothetical protein
MNRKKLQRHTTHARVIAARWTLAKWYESRTSRT